MTRAPLRIVTSALLAMSLVASEVSVASAQSRHHNGGIVRSSPRVFVGRGYNRGRNIGLGIAGAVITGAIIAGAVNSRGRYSCSALEWRCDHGSDWACHQLEIRGEC